MPIESNPQLQPSPETNPFSRTPIEIAASEALFAPAVDYTQKTNDQAEAPVGQASGAEGVVVPQLRVDGETIEEKEFENGLLKADQIPQLEPLPSEPAPREPRHRL